MRRWTNGMKSTVSNTVPCRLNEKGGPPVPEITDETTLYSFVGTRRRDKKSGRIKKRVRESSQKVAARPGLEPRLNEPESLVLPLHQRAVNEIII